MQPEPQSLGLSCGRSAGHVLAGPSPGHLSWQMSEGRVRDWGVEISSAQSVRKQLLKRALEQEHSSAPRKRSWGTPHAPCTGLRGWKVRGVLAGFSLLRKGCDASPTAPRKAGVLPASCLGTAAGQGRCRRCLGGRGGASSGSAEAGTGRSSLRPGPSGPGFSPGLELGQARSHGALGPSWRAPCPVG